MRAVKGKNKILSLISLEEARIFNKVEMAGVLNISNLTEREQAIANDLYVKNVLQKVRKNDYVGYKIYPQREQL